jgi:hypothetical protein
LSSVHQVDTVLARRVFFLWVSFVIFSADKDEARIPLLEKNFLIVRALRIDSRGKKDSYSETIVGKLKEQHPLTK